MPGSKSPESYCCHQHRCENQVRSDSDLQSAPVAVLLVFGKESRETTIRQHCSTWPRDQEPSEWEVIRERRRSEKMEETIVSTMFASFFFFFLTLWCVFSPSWLLISSLIFERGREKEEQQHALTSSEVKDNSWAIAFGVLILNKDALGSKLFNIYTIFGKTQALFFLIKTKPTHCFDTNTAHWLTTLWSVTGNCLALLCLLLPAATEHCSNTASAPSSRCRSYTTKRGKDTAAATSERLGSSTPGEKRHTKKHLGD